VQGGVGVNPGMGLGQDLFVQGSATLTFDDGLVTFWEGVSDQSTVPGYSNDKLGLDIYGTGFVELGNNNTFQGLTTVGDEALAVQDEADRADPPPNGLLELLPGSTLYSGLEIQVYAGAFLSIDAGSDFSGSIDLGLLQSGDPFSFEWTPDLTATTLADVLPWTVVNFPGGSGGSIDMPDVAYDGDDLSILNIGGVLRVVTLASDGQPYIASLSGPTGGDQTGTTMTLAPLDTSAFTVSTVDEVLMLSDALISEGSSAPATATVTFATASGVLSLSGPADLGPAAGETLTITSLIEDATDPAGVGSLVIDGVGTVVLTGADTFSGGVTLASGDLDIASDGAAGSGTILMDSAGTVALTFDVGADDFAGAITVESGTADLTGAPDYAGVVTLQGGSLDLQSSASGWTGSIVVAAGTGGVAALALDAASQDFAAPITAESGDFELTGGSDKNGTITVAAGAGGTATLTLDDQLPARSSCRAEPRSSRRPAPEAAP